MQKTIFLLFIIMTLLIIGCASTQINCPDIKLHDFNQEVETKEEAITLFREYFSEENGYPQFNESAVTAPSNHLKPFENAYIYNDMYDSGGVLYENGKLVRKRYCK